MTTSEARFSIGQVIRHRLFDYRGVIYDIDPDFQGTDEWYDTMARSKPPKDQPWYHVLVDGADHTTYVAEQNLDLEPIPKPVTHPAIRMLFEEYVDGRYAPRRQVN